MFPLFDETSDDKVKTYKYKADDLGFKITKFNDSTWIITGERIEKLYKMTNLSDDQGFIYLTSTMRKMGVESELERLGAKEGDTVKLLDFEFTYYK